MLMFCTQMFGLLTELLARPGKRGEDGYRGWANDPIRSDAVLAAELKRRKIMEYPYRVKRHPRLPYHHAMEKLSPEARRRFENPEQVPVPDMLSDEEQYLLTRYAQSYTLAWVQRMFPHVLGFFPYITIWVILIQHFLDSLNDVRKENEALWELIPDFVVPAVFGTLVIFSSFTFVQYAVAQIERTHAGGQVFTYRLAAQVALPLHFARPLVAERDLVLRALSHGQAVSRRLPLLQRAAHGQRRGGARLGKLDTHG